MKRVSWEKMGYKAIISFENSALDQNFIESFVTVVEKATEDDEVRVIILTGAKGRSFFTGHDLRLPETTETLSDVDVEGKQNQAIRVMDCIEKCPKPVIAAVDGFAVGGGFEIVLACDLVYASERAKFGTPEVKMGLIAAAGGTIKLPRQISKHQAMEMALIGKIYSPYEAREMGLVNDVFEHEILMTEVSRIAEKICENAPLAVSATKKMINSSISYIEKYIEDMFNEANAECLNSEDVKEGIAAFLEKRKPNFTGK